MVRVILPLAIDIQQYSTFFISLSFRVPLLPLSFSLCLLHVNLQSFVCFYNLCHFRLLFVLAFETLTLLCVFVRSEYATDGIKEWQKWTSTESAWFTWPADKKISSFILFVQFTGQFIHYHQVFMVYSKYTLYALSFIVSQFEEFKKQNYMFWELNWIKRWNEIVYYSTKRE